MDKTTKMIKKDLTKLQHIAAKNMEKNIGNITQMAKIYSVKLTRKAPRTTRMVAKGVGELLNETSKRLKNWAKVPKQDRCYKPTVAINEKYLHNNKPCKKPTEERTKNFCVTKLIKAKDEPKNIKWVKTIVPNKSTRITIVCPK